LGLVTAAFVVAVIGGFLALTLLNGGGADAATSRRAAALNARRLPAR
jgi:hypothetical protein